MTHEVLRVPVEQLPENVRAAVLAGRSVELTQDGNPAGVILPVGVQPTVWLTGEEAFRAAAGM